MAASHAEDTCNRIVQLYFFTIDSPHVVRHIALREYLRAHPEAAGAYENEKRRAQSLHPNDSHAYSDEKAAWIRHAEARALNWFDSIRAFDAAKAAGDEAIPFLKATQEIERSRK